MITLLATTALRVSMGSFFTATGYNKLFNKETSANVDHLFDKLHVPVRLRPLVKGGEFLGGLGLLAGCLTREAAGGLILIMLGALCLDCIPNDWVAKHPKNLADWVAKFWMMPESLITLILIVIALLGGGPLSLDHLLTLL